MLRAPPSAQLDARKAANHPHHWLPRNRRSWHTESKTNALSLHFVPTGIGCRAEPPAQHCHQKSLHSDSQTKLQDDPQVLQTFSAVVEGAREGEVVDSGAAVVSEVVVCAVLLSGVVVDEGVVVAGSVAEILEVEINADVEETH